MGSGSRLKLYRNDEFGLGFGLARFPFALTIWFRLFFWNAMVGLGKGYDQ